MSTSIQTIVLLGKPYRVKCPVGQEQVLQAAAQSLSEQLKHTQRNSGLTSREDIIMMTALNLCHHQLEQDPG